MSELFLGAGISDQIKQSRLKITDILLSGFKQLGVYFLVTAAVRERGGTLRKLGCDLKAQLFI